MRRRPPLSPLVYGLCSTGMVSFTGVSTSAWASLSSTPFVAGDISSESGATLPRTSTYHARCPYCGTARKPFTYVNCLNCGAPA